MVAGLLALAATASSGSPWIVAGLLVLTGLGGSIAMPPVTSVVLASAPVERASTASAVFNTFRQIGGAVAIAVLGGLLAGASSFVPGLQLSLVVAAAVVAIAAVSAVFLRRKHGGA
jgi:DHA2 family methylenomycin A resistance protein-like MFS transporter